MTIMLNAFIVSHFAFMHDVHKIITTKSWKVECLTWKSPRPAWSRSTLLECVASTNDLLAPKAKLKAIIYSESLVALPRCKIVWRAFDSRFHFLAREYEEHWQRYKMCREPKTRYLCSWRTSLEDYSSWRHVSILRLQKSHICRY